MLLINYIRPNIIIYADYLIFGEISIIDAESNLLLNKIVKNETLVNIKISNLAKYHKITVIIKTQKETIKKSFHNTSIKFKI